jgi:predicted transposase YbfD/YdcC
LCGVVCGANNWVEIEAYGKAKYEWLRQFLALPNGIPSHDTFGDVFARIDPEAFERCFPAWVNELVSLSGGQVVAIDGKTLRGASDSGAGKRAIHMVSAWASANGLVLGQVKVDEKSNEITAIPALLELLALTGCTVTIDAMGCQTAIAEQIVKHDAEYVLSLKENQGRLYEDVRDLFSHARIARQSPYPLQHVRTVEKGHGRLEIRECWTLTDPHGFPSLRTTADWAGLHTLVMLQRERRINDRVSRETAYFIASALNSAHHFLACTRAHWSIENSLHWVLDVSFQEDASRVRKDFAPQNLALIRHFALNLLKSEKSTKASIQTKRLKAGWDDAYLLKILSV